MMMRLMRAASEGLESIGPDQLSPLMKKVALKPAALRESRILEVWLGGPLATSYITGRTRASYTPGPSSNVKAMTPCFLQFLMGFPVEREG